MKIEQLPRPPRGPRPVTWRTTRVTNRGYYRRNDARLSIYCGGSDEPLDDGSRSGYPSNRQAKKDYWRECRRDPGLALCVDLVWSPRFKNRNAKARRLNRRRCVIWDTLARLNRERMTKRAKR